MALAHCALDELAFIQMAGSSARGRYRLILRDLEPTTIWLHRATGEVGHMSTGTFLDLWWAPASGLAPRGLTALLGQADPEAADGAATPFVLRSPRICGSGLQYDVDPPEAECPSHTGACVLFLGPARAEYTEAPGAHSR